MRSHLPIIAAIGLLAVITAGCGRESDGGVVARVNQSPITQDQLWEFLEKSDNGSPARQALDSLIVHQLLRLEAEKRDVRVAREEIDVRLEGMKDYVLATTGNDFDVWLEETGQTEQDVTNRISLQILTAKMVLTPEDRQKYFEANKEQFAELPHNNESVIYRQIVVRSQEEADALYAELTGEGAPDFAAIAEGRSLDPMTRSQGGMAGWLVKGKSAEPELERLLFSLDPGQVGKPLVVRRPEPESDDGEAGPPPGAQVPTYWRVIKVERHLRPGAEITLEANISLVEDLMLSDPQFQFQLNQFFSNLRAQADVEVLSPRYKAVGDVYRRQREARQRRSAPTGALPVSPAAPAGPSAPPAGASEPGAAEE
jgi:parvulin-like peptidyl-prolyl isomerase